MYSLRAAVCCGLLVMSVAAAQTTGAKGTLPVSSDAAALRAVSLAENGRCLQALPQLLKVRDHIDNPDLMRRAGVAGVRCSMSIHDASSAVSFLTALNRRFPHDPAVLYLSSHVYSDLSLRASNELLSSAPGSAEVHELNAEALETMGKWKEAAEEYRSVLARDPRMAGVHYRLGRLLLSQPDAAPSAKEDARRQFEEEVKIDPSNAGAEFVLGELARQAEQWPDAIAHFSRATALDAGFADAWIGLGRSYISAGKAPEAVTALEKAAQIQPENPVVHFQLATAYRRAGRKADADREFLIHQQASEKAQQTADQIKKQITGGVVEKAPPAEKRPE